MCRYSMNTTQTQMSNRQYVDVSTMTHWELARLNFRLANGPNVKYQIDEIDD